MALTQRLEIRQSHALVMTPQLMQAIKLLQLSNLDLTTYVEGELERNPLLERVEGEGAGEGESERRRADENIVLRRLQAGARKTIAHRDHVAMEVYGALRLAGGAGSKGDQRHVFRGSVDILECCGLLFT